MELQLDGTSNSFSTYHTSPEVIWSNEFVKGPAEKWSRDLIHDMGQCLKTSPDNKMLAASYGVLEEKAERGSGWRLEIWILDRNNAKRRIILSDPFKADDAKYFLWSRTCNYLVYQRTGSSDKFLIDVKAGELETISYAGVEIGRGNAIWHPVKDILIAPIKKKSDSGISDFGLLFIDLDQNLSRVFISDHADAISTIDISPNGQFIASSGFDNSLVLWDTHSDNNWILPIDGQIASRIEFSPDSKRLITQIGFGQSKIVIWNVEKKEKIQEFEGDLGLIKSSVWHMDGRMLVYAKNSNILEVRKLIT